jgi:hypothetical protein
MGSLYIVGKPPYKAFTLSVVDGVQKNKIDTEFIRDFLNKSWPMKTSTGDSDLADIKDGGIGDVAVIVIVVGGDELSTETYSYERQPLQPNEATHRWELYGVQLAE